MKAIFFLPLIALFSCKKENDIIKKEVSLSQKSINLEDNSAKEDSTNKLVRNTLNFKKEKIEDSFIIFCNNFLQKNNNNILSYFDFPIPDTDNFYIQPLIDFNSELNSESNKKELKLPLSKEEFIINYNNLFSKDFINSLQLINKKDIFLNERYNTKYIQKNKTTKYSLGFEYNKTKKQVILTLNYLFKDDGEEYGTSLFYYLDYVEDKFKITKIILTS